MGEVCLEVKIVIGIFLVLCSITDLKQKTIPISYVLVSFVVLVLLTFLQKDLVYLSRLKGMSIGGALLVLGKVTRGQIGDGDGILFCLTGLGLGFWNNFYLLFLSLLFSAMFSIVMLTIKKMNRKQTFPFVPFILVAYLGVLCG